MRSDKTSFSDFKRLQPDNWGFKYLSGYKNLNSSCNFRCVSCGSEFARVAKKALYSLCPNCPKPKDAYAYSDKEVRSLFKDWGLTLVSRSDGGITYQCQAGHERTLKHFNRRTHNPGNPLSCPSCAAKRHSQEALSKMVAKFATVVRYESGLDVTFKCNQCGQNYEYGERKFGARRCPRCYTVPTKLDLDVWAARLKSLDVTPVAHDGEYYRLKCSVGHVFKLRYLGNYTGCPSCLGSSKVSTPHKRLYNWLRQRVPTEVNKRGLVKNIEGDLYVESKKLVIEVDGVYWHNEAQGETANKRLLRRKRLESAGYTLLRFWDFELQRPKALLGYLSSKLGLSRITVGARQCTIARVDPSVAKPLLDTWHLQGYAPASVNYGLYHDKKLVGLMSFGKPRLNINYEWELLRFCVVGGYNIQGGASKLFAKFVSDFNPSSVLSYCDRRYSNGDLYGKLGFTLLRVSSPGYFYSKGAARVSRYRAQKHKLTKLLGSSFDPALSEAANMAKAGYSKSFDCGQFVFIFGNAKGKARYPDIVEHLPVPRGKSLAEFTSTIADKITLVDPPSHILKKTALKARCTCGHAWTTSAGALSRNRTGGCPKCANRYPLANLISRLAEVNPDVEYVGGYTRLTAPAQFRYKPTGKVFTARAYSVYEGRIPHAAKTPT